MPKVKYITGKKPVKVNYLAGVFAAYRAAYKLTSEDVAARVGCTAQNVRCQWSKPADQWSIGQLKTYCEAMGIPISEAEGQA